jgi:hypothetical protein
MRIVIFAAAFLFVAVDSASAQQAFNFGNTFTARSALGPKPRASCGWYMRSVFGGRYGREFNLAQTWYRRLPKTTARPGAVVVWTRGGNKGHVARIVRVTGQCRAVVNDNAGTYERDICRRVLGYVSAG